MHISKKLLPIFKKYSVTEAYLFGSYAKTPKIAKDIDIALDMRQKADFFYLSAEIADVLDKPVDIVYLGDGSKFSQLVRRDGVRLHG